MTPAYTYRASVLRVIDGDTVELNVDLGFHVSHRITTRLLGIDAPELRYPEGKAAKAFLAALLPEGLACVVTTQKRPGDKYGRWIADITLGTEHTVSQALVSAGHAIPFMTGA